MTREQRTVPKQIGQLATGLASIIASMDESKSKGQSKSVNDQKKSWKKKKNRKFVKLIKKNVDNHSRKLTEQNISIREVCTI